MAIMLYIATRKPELVLLENVAGLVLCHRSILNELTESLEEMGYYVSWRILNSQTNSGIPHRRSRLYIIALKLSNTWPCLADGSRPAHPMHPRMPPIGSTYRVVWPRPIECQPLSAFLDPSAKIPSYQNYPIHVVARNKTFRNNLVSGLAKVQETARRKGVPAESLEVILDLGGSKPNIGYGVSPCLTHSRGKAHAFMSLQHGVVLSTNVLCKFSGLSMSALNTREITRGQLGGLLGNGYSPQVVARVISSGLMALAEQSGMARVQVPRVLQGL